MNNPEDLLPGYSSDQIMDRIEDKWEFIDNCVPWPKFTVECPSCDSQDVVVSRISVGNRSSSPNSYRSDVGFKCALCSRFWTHGVVIPEKVSNKFVRKFDSVANYSDLLEYFDLERDN